MAVCKATNPEYQYLASEHLDPFSIAQQCAVKQKKSGINVMGWRHWEGKKQGSKRK